MLRPTKKAPIDGMSPEEADDMTQAIDLTVEARKYFADELRQRMSGTGYDKTKTAAVASAYADLLRTEILAKDRLKAARP